LTRREQSAHVETAVAEAAGAAIKVGPMGQAFPVTGAAAQRSGIPGKPIADVAAAVEPKKSDKAVQVSLTLTAQSWLRVMVDGKQAYEGVLSEGDQRTWEANEAVSVRAGNAGGVMVKVNNKPAVPMGNPGAVEEATYNSKQVAEAGLPATSAAATTLPVGMVGNF
jgi:hypothetical protein